MKRPDEFYLASLWLRVSLWFKGLFKPNPNASVEVGAEPTPEFIEQVVQENKESFPVSDQVADYKAEIDLKILSLSPNVEPAWHGAIGSDVVSLPAAATHGSQNRGIEEPGVYPAWLSPYITPRSDANLGPSDYRIPWPDGHPLAGFKLTGTPEELAAGLQDHDANGDRNKYEY